MPIVKKRRRLKKKYRIILFFICVFLVLFIVIKTFFKKDESNNVVKNPNSNNYKSLITDSIESDHDSAIDTIFANGMNIESYKAIADQKANYMKSNGKYNYIDYDFDSKLHYNEIEDIIKNINNSDIVNVEIIGKSADKRNIYGIEIGTGKKVLYLDKCFKYINN